MTFRSACDVSKLLKPALVRELVLTGLRTIEDAGQLTVKVIRGLLIGPCKLPKNVKAVKEAKDTTVVNVSRGVSTANQLVLAWDPAACGHEDWQSTRAEVIAHARAKFPDKEQLSDLELIGFLCDKSSFFYGRWMLFEVEIRVCTVPFLALADGNMEPYLRMFPLMMQVRTHTHTRKGKTHMCFLNPFSHS